MQKNPFISLFIVAAVVVLAVVFNPSPEKHRTKMQEAIAERSPLAGMLGIGVLKAFVSSYHSVGVASYTRVDDRMVTIGALGVVLLVQ